VGIFEETTETLGLTIDVLGLAVGHHADGRVVLIDEVEPGVVRVGLYADNGTDTPTKMVEFDEAGAAVAAVRGWGF
jgi:hypothetical protein